MAGDARGSLPLGSGQGDVGRLGRPDVGGGGAGGNGDSECATEIGKAAFRCGESVQLPTGEGVRNRVSPRHCPEPKIFGKKWEIGQRAGASSEWGGGGSSGGGGAGDGSTFSACVGPISGKRLEAIVVGGTSSFGAG